MRSLERAERPRVLLAMQQRADALGTEGCRAASGAGLGPIADARSSSAFASAQLARGNISGNIQIVHCVHCVQISGRVGRSGRIGSI
jgi:hypothetical protein